MTLDITYTTEDPAPAYSKAIRAAKTLEALIAAVEQYEHVASDALYAVRSFSNDDFLDFKKKLKDAAKNMPEKWISAFIDRYGVIVVPEKMMLASLLSDQYHVPWGTAVKRFDEMGWPV
jgi:hypothetical protein